MKTGRERAAISHRLPVNVNVNKTKFISTLEQLCIFLFTFPEEPDVITPGKRLSETVSFWFEGVKDIPEPVLGKVAPTLNRIKTPTHNAVLIGA